MPSLWRLVLFKQQLKQMTTNLQSIRAVFPRKDHEVKILSTRERVQCDVYSDVCCNNFRKLDNYVPGQCRKHPI